MRGREKGEIDRFSESFRKTLQGAGQDVDINEKYRDEACGKAREDQPKQNSCQRAEKSEHKSSAPATRYNLYICPGSGLNRNRGRNCGQKTRDLPPE
jgi:hypothetical protein